MFIFLDQKAIFENERTRSEIGIAEIDLKFSSLKLSQFSDNQSYSCLLNKIGIIEPSEVQYTVTNQSNSYILLNHLISINKILISTSSFENIGINHLHNLIEKNIANTKITTIKSRFFNKKKGLDYIRKLCAVDSKNCSELFSKYFQD